MTGVLTRKNEQPEQRVEAPAFDKALALCRAEVELLEEQRGVELHDHYGRISRQIGAEGSRRES